MSINHQVNRKINEDGKISKTETINNGDLDRVTKIAQEAVSELYKNRCCYLVFLKGKEV
ncbi:hypothetical protein L3Q72_06200 [Vibrio sp. JC009]|uniref:hypothetical protein n=1 Tax=Vibrio sp. JC009 TaxID=2912314 RepID=UPI0023AFF67A|nr:hypothetical protein [Vibrio sp. JC009]WED22983.1 hypothetical protein L3Q72_06200 [Vibrio sp. JC009]